LSHGNEEKEEEEEVRKFFSWGSEEFKDSRFLMVVMMMGKGRE
jgi:hypothetical protein